MLLGVNCLLTTVQVASKPLEDCALAIDGADDVPCQMPRIHIQLATAEQTCIHQGLTQFHDAPREDLFMCCDLDGMDSGETRGGCSSVDALLAVL